MRDDKLSRARVEEKLETLILEGLTSGEPIEVTPEFWEKMRQGMMERHGRRARKDSTPRKSLTDGGRR